MVNQVKRPSIWHWFSLKPIMLGLSGVLTVAGLVFGSVGSAYAAQSTKTIAPDIEVTPLTAQAMPGGTLMYKFHVNNNNVASQILTRVDVTIRYDQNTLTLVDSKLRSSSDFVSKVKDGKATVQFGEIDQGDERSATLIFHVNAAAPLGAPILTDGSYQWWSTNAWNEGGLTISNVIVSSTPATTAISPASGPADTIFQIYVTGFEPGEQVVTWLNTPAGVQPLALSGTADGNGTVQLQFNSAGLAPGNYSVVVHGLDSDYNSVLSFTITASNVAAATTSVAGILIPVNMSGFKPDEQIVTWLNAPAGVQPLALSGTADGNGNVQLQFNTAGLSAGYYGLVVHGRSSGVEHVLPFSVGE